MKKQLKKNILRFIISVFLYSSIISLSWGQESKVLIVDKIIAKVDNYILLQSDLEGVYLNFLSNGGTASSDAKCGVFNQLLMNKLLVAKAEIDSIVVTDFEVDKNTDARMNIILQNSGNSNDLLEKTYGKSLAQIKLELREQIREQMLASQMQQKITSDISITPAGIRRFFNKIPTDSLPFYSADVVVGQIVRVAKVSKDQKRKTINKLLDIRQQILGGKDFSEMAKKYSEDPSVQYNGGEMGYVGRGAMVSSYEAMAFRIKEGEISHPFESSFGFHIMQLIDRRGNEYNSRHILISPSSSEDDVLVARKFLDSLRNEIIEENIKFEEVAKLYSDDLATKSFGGYFTDESGGVKISLKDLDPVVYFQIDTMEIGTISLPIFYRTDDGKNAVRILYFKNRLPPHQASLSDDWYRIQSAAVNQKKDRAIRKWFDQARHTVYIQADPVYEPCMQLDQW